jgi:hypothetical protein
MEKVQTPFTEEQVENLNKFQMSGVFHPFTCCSAGPADKCERRLGTSEGILVASTDGWVCPCGEYKQNWAHDFMAQDHK